MIHSYEQTTTSHLVCGTAMGLRSSGLPVDVDWVKQLV